jgi:hypothetical protein
MWRRLALEQMPSLHQIISEADGPMMMWIELRLALYLAYDQQPRDEMVISQVYGYARWCFFGSGNPALVTAVAYAFYEHLPQERETRRDLPKRLSIDEFEQLRGVFEYHLGEAGLKELAAEFREAKKRPDRG